MPRHSKYGRNSNTSAMAFSAARLPSHGTTRLYWFSTFASPALQLAQQHHDGLQNIQRLEAGDDDRLAFVAARSTRTGGSRSRWRRGPGR